MNCVCKRLLIGIIAALFALSAPQAGAKEAVDLELFMATDVSWSIDEAEAQLQRQGIADAFRSKEIVHAIRSGILRRIAVAHVDYSSADFNRVVIDWRIIHDRGSAQKFADDLINTSLSSGRRTSISDAVELAVGMIESNNIEGTRRVIDVSGDGPNNWGQLVDDVRDATIKRRITINGLPIMNPADTFNSGITWPISISIIVAASSADPALFTLSPTASRITPALFGVNLCWKLPAPRDNDVPRAIFLKASSNTRLRTSPAGYTYPKGCDIGERMRGFISDDP